MNLRGRKQWRAIMAGLVTASLLVTGCSAGLPRADPEAITVRTCAGGANMTPAAVADECTEQVLDPVLARLTRATSEGEIENDLAASVTPSEKDTVWTVSVAQGRTFSDGTEVRAHNFVDAWNWSASCVHSYAGARWFADIEGFAELNPAGKCPFGSAQESPPLSGLTVVDDHTFRVKLTRPIHDFDARLSELAFAPLPDAFWVDPDHFAEVPVGAGPYRLVESNKLRRVIERWDGYSGPVDAQASMISFEVWDDLGLAYEAVRDGSLDVSDRVPPVAMTARRWVSDFDSRTVSPDAGADPTLTHLVFDRSDAVWADPRRRRALSMTIDREFLTEKILGSVHEPARGWVPPRVDGAVDACGQSCEYAPDEARRLWDEANAESPAPASLTVTVAGEFGDHHWAAELCNTWTYELGVTCEVEIVQEIELRQSSSGRLTVVQQSSEVNAPDGYLMPYRTGHPSNMTHYSDADFDGALKRAEETAQPQDWEAAQRKLAQDPPSAPLWWTGSTTVWSKNLEVDDAGIPRRFSGEVDVVRLR